MRGSSARGTAAIRCAARAAWWPSRSGSSRLPVVLARGLRARGVGARGEDVLTFDLMAYDTQPAVVAGARGEFVLPARLDNLASCHAALHALVRAARGGPAAATRGIVF